MSVTIADIDPIFLKNYEFVVGELDYRKHLDQVLLTPQTETQTWRGAGGNTHADVAVVGWQCTAGYMQDWSSADSFARFLQEHAGETLAVTFNPTAGGGTSWDVPLVIVPGPVGGPVGSPANVTVTLACASDPIPTYPAGE
jgi:hypothetical protein